MIGEYMLEEFCRIPVEVEYASEFRYRNPVIDEPTLVIVISQCGETADTLAAVREAKRRGARVLGICNVVGSSDRPGGRRRDLHPRRSGDRRRQHQGLHDARWRSLVILTLYLGRLRGRPRGSRPRALIQGLRDIPAQMETILQGSDRPSRRSPPIYAEHNNFLYLGRGYNFPVALEGALKLKEISYIHAEGYPAAEMKHGPIALIDENMPVVFLCTRDTAYEKILSNMEEVRARRGRIIAMATEEDEDLVGKADHVIRDPADARCA